MMSLKPESTRFLTSSQPMPPAPTMSTRVVERSVPVRALVTSARDDAIVVDERKRSEVAAMWSARVATVEPIR